jgi:uncharacterized protein (DUF58 family)
MLNRMRRAAGARLTRWSARRHGTDRLPLTIHRRRIYIVPTRFGIALALLLAAMLLAGLNYNSNLGLAFGFLMVSLSIVAMHHCNRNLLQLGVDVKHEADAFAGGHADFDFLLHNEAGFDRRDIEIRCASATGPGGCATATVSVPAGSYSHAVVSVPVARRGVTRLPRFELRTRHPLGWFRAWTYVQSPLTIFVAPQPRGEALPAAESAATAAQFRAQSEQRGDEDFAGLRSYQTGVPLKHMAWKVLARGGEPAVRDYSASAAQPKWLDFASLSRLETEARLSQLCRWVEDSAAAHGTYGLRIPGTEIPPSRGLAHRAACLRALARCAPAPP